MLRKAKRLNVTPTVTTRRGSAPPVATKRTLTLRAPRKARHKRH